jgi:3-oxoacyl-[acyl-carrier-protein] synthase-3
MNNDQGIRLPYGARIVSTGVYLPEKRLTNFDLEKMIDTTDEWIRTRTGIRERRIAADHEATSDLGIAAAKDCLGRAGFDPKELDLVILATYTPDRLYSATGCIVQHAIGATRAGAFDLEAACSGYVYSLAIASQFIKSGLYSNILIVGSDINSRFMNWEDRTTCFLFGDGAAATLVGRCAPGDGVLEGLLGSDGGGSEALFLPAGGSRMPATAETVAQRKHTMYMNGPEVFKFSTRKVAEVMQTLARPQRPHLRPDLTRHPAPGERIIESAAKRFNADGALYPSTRPLANRRRDDPPALYWRRRGPHRARRPRHARRLRGGSPGAARSSWC